MVSVYNDADYLSAYKQKNKTFLLFWSVTAVYAAFCITWWIYYMGLPYNHSNQTWAKAAVFIATGLYVIFAFPYLAIKGSRIRRYCKMLSYLSEGMKQEEKNYFYAFQKKSLQKDNIDVWGCVFETWSKKKSEWMDREAYWDNEKPLPPFENGDYVRYIVQSNFILQYDILEKHALEFEVLDEETDETDEGYVPEDVETEDESV